MKGADTIRVLRNIFDGISHVSSIFPDDTNLIWTLTAHANANTWSDWTEIQDSGGNKLSDLYITAHGYVTAIMLETLSEDDAIYMFELAWGADKVIFARGRTGGSTKFYNPITTARFWPIQFPENVLLYYRLKTDTAVADTCTAHLRHHSD